MNHYLCCAPQISCSCATYVLKRTRSNGAAKSQQLGLAREFKFYEHTKAAAGSDALAPLAAYLPSIVYSGGSMESGLKDILMQDLTSAVQSGYFFGPFSPHNWNKDLATLMRGWDTEAGLDAASVTALAFTAAANVHAPLWNRHDDLQHLPWLKCVHVDRVLWLESQQQAAAAWEAERSKPVGSIDWHPLLVACLDASLSRARAEAGGWEAFQTELKTRPLTLVHGDFHPGNMMIAREASGCRLFLLDWEVVGVGSGPQELGQYVAGPSCANQIDAFLQVSHFARITPNPGGNLAGSRGGLLRASTGTEPRRCRQHDAGQLRVRVRQRRGGALVLVLADFGDDVPAQNDAVLSRSSAGFRAVSQHHA